MMREAEISKKWKSNQVQKNDFDIIGGHRRKPHRAEERRSITKNEIGTSGLSSTRLKL